MRPLRPQRHLRAYLGRRCPLSSARPNKRNVVCTQSERRDTKQCLGSIFIIYKSGRPIYYYCYYIYIYFIPSADRAVRVTNCSENCGPNDHRFRDPSEAKCMGRSSTYNKNV